MSGIPRNSRATGGGVVRLAPTRGRGKGLRGCPTMFRAGGMLRYCALPKGHEAPCAVTSEDV